MKAVSIGWPDWQLDSGAGTRVKIYDSQRRLATCVLTAKGLYYVPSPGSS
jgi:hypothetical protein